MNIKSETEFSLEESFFYISEKSKYPVYNIKQEMLGQYIKVNKIDQDLPF